MNKERIISSIILIPIVVLLLVLGNKYIIDVVFGALCILAMREYFNAISKKCNPIRWIGYILSILVCFIHVIPGVYLISLVVFLVPLLIIILFTYLIATNMKTNLTDITNTLFGICYVIGLSVFIPLLYSTSNGKILIWYILMSAWGTDIFAYSIGRRIGKHKFTKISPNKSIEGCIAGVFGAIICVLGYTYLVNTYMNMSISYLYMGIVSIILSIFGQLGDLAASGIKRHVKIKDFSRLIPGHGGILDRMDSIIFMAPIAYILLTII